MIHLLFVCTGNTCRSPMAAFFAKNEIHERGLDWTADSAGAYAPSGQPMAHYAADALTRRHIPLQAHSSKSLTEELVNQADAILVMTKHHQADVEARFPAAKGKVALLGRFEQENSPSKGAECDIVDPFGGFDTEYEACAEQLQKAVSNLISHLASNGTLE